MSFQRSLIAGAVLSALASLNSAAVADSAINTVTVSSNPLGNDENMQILTPAKILSGPELRAKLGTSLGDTLGGELGVAASGFGAGASRPIIRGLEGPRVKILQNGMGVADVSSLSNDHAVASESATAQQIEILRGPAALLYGSGAIGGLVNVVDERIPTVLSKQVSGEAEVRYGSVNQEKNASFSLLGSSGDVAYHLDGNTRSTADYRIPGRTEPGNPNSASGKLPNSFTRESSFGIGAALIKDWGHAGAAVQTMSDRYGIPTAEKSFIDLQQNRLDIDGMIKAPLAGFDSLHFKLADTDYKHTEKMQNGTPITDFTNKSLETRISLAHKNWAGWEGSWGMQTEHIRFSALSASTGRSDTVPTTKSASFALFAVEQKAFGDVMASAGARIENVKRDPAAQFQLPGRSFNIGSASAGGLWQFTPGYGIGATLSMAQRAPSTEELYSNGPHESTATYDIGSNALKKESSRNLELSAQKTTGLVRWKINAFLNKVSNYVYGHSDGTKVTAEGNPDINAEFTRRYWSQASATIRGGEAELSYNQHGEGWSARAFADTSRGTLDDAGNLPLQPATRFGADLNYKMGPWNGGFNVLRAQSQDRLASFENYVTPGYTKLDASLTYTHAYNNSQLTWFLLAKNLLNQDIRLATSVLKESVPQPGRGVVAGVRVMF
ncbi:TonB-dependent receptor [Undibacterium sp. Jales W-56]|uniref:TonB-dependent receptor n=1 Tax=Undibacterium sp. Jales W-56 TaxID=2897325 RepID=UPI0021D19E75|nr:TonB-dependent receptor [Undibacterium sp. Jales W-56]MCU6434990.1 TonB-dependent receptor [Undibacterium sp. Jales W-56]